MPHAISPEPSPAQEDTILPDAPAHSVDTASANGTDGEDDTSTQQNETMGAADNGNMSLDDMFDDEDEEFSSSAPQNQSQDASQEPMYVVKNPVKRSDAHRE